jgi:small GTP-binding protein
MWSNIFKLIAAPLAIVVAKYGYEKYSERNKTHSPPSEKPKSLGKFAIWGRPNAGKTTFIRRLLRKSISSQKEVTTARTTYTSIPIVEVSGRKYQIAEIADMPGNTDRQNDWLKLVACHEHVFYMINLALASKDAEYRAAVRSDLKATVSALKNSEKSEKRINIIASHIDKTPLKDVDPAEITNRLQSDDEFCHFYESIEGVSGYVYSVNLIEVTSFNRLLESIIKDCDDNGA